CVSVSRAATSRGLFFLTDLIRLGLSGPAVLFLRRHRQTSIVFLSRMHHAALRVGPNASVSRPCSYPGLDRSFAYPRATHSTTSLPIPLPPQRPHSEQPRDHGSPRASGSRGAVNCGAFYDCHPLSSTATGNRNGLTGPVFTQVSHIDGNDQPRPLAGLQAAHLVIIENKQTASRPPHMSHVELLAQPRRRTRI